MINCNKVVIIIIIYITITARVAQNEIMRQNRIPYRNLRLKSHS